MMKSFMPYILAPFCILTTVPALAGELTLESDLKNGTFAGDNILSQAYGFGCDGGNISPAFYWSHAPEGTKSFALRIYDKDAPTGLGWVHWVVVNIPANVTRLEAGAKVENHHLPEGALETRTDFGVPGYGGACPPQGQTHRYEVTLTALKTAQLPMITRDATPAMVGFFVKANALAEASLTITHGR